MIKYCLIHCSSKSDTNVIKDCVIKLYIVSKTCLVNSFWNSISRNNKWVFVMLVAAYNVWPLKISNFTHSKRHLLNKLYELRMIYFNDILCFKLIFTMSQSVGWYSIDEDQDLKQKYSKSHPKNYAFVLEQIFRKNNGKIQSMIDISIL